MKVTSAYVTYMLITSVLLFMFISNILTISQIIDIQLLTMRVYNIITTATILILTGTISLVIPYFIMKHSSPRQILNESGE